MEPENKAVKDELEKVIKKIESSKIKEKATWG